MLLVIAMQILNLSVYGMDSNDDLKDNTIGEYNQMDSLVEYVTEIILDYKNAFPENGAHNHHSGLSHQMKHITIKMISFKKKNAPQVSYCSTHSVIIPSKEEYKNMFSREVIPPPPKA